MREMSRERYAVRAFVSGASRRGCCVGKQSLTVFGNQVKRLCHEGRHFAGLLQRVRWMVVCCVRMMTSEPCALCSVCDVYVVLHSARRFKPAEPVHNGVCLWCATKPVWAETSVTTVHHRVIRLLDGWGGGTRVVVLGERARVWAMQASIRGLHLVASSTSATAAPGAATHARWGWSPRPHPHHQPLVASAE